MKKFLFTILMSLSSVTFCFSQDVITKKSGDDIQAKVLEITSDDIKYKKFDNLNGPTYTIQKSEVFMIRYENGTKDVFNQEKINEIASTQLKSSSDLYVQGQTDAAKYYKGYKAAGTGTLITGLVSPLVGLIPAIACSSTEPKDTKLNYPYPELMKKTDYYNGYTKKAKKIKQGKVWTNWGIAFGVNLLAAIILLN